MIRRLRDLAAGFLFGLAFRWALDAWHQQIARGKLHRALEAIDVDALELYGRAIDTGELVPGIRIRPLSPDETAAAELLERELARAALDDPGAIAG